MILTGVGYLKGGIVNEILSIAEIESRFDSEWVLVGDPETDEALHVLSGRVLAHSRDCGEVYRKAIELKPSRSAMPYLGAMPENTAIAVSGNLSTRLPG